MKNMPNLTIILVVFAILTMACLGLAWSAQDGTDLLPAATATLEADTHYLLYPRESVTPSPIPTPSPDYGATATTIAGTATQNALDGLHALETVQAYDLLNKQLDNERLRLENEQLNLTATFFLGTVNADNATSSAMPTVIPTTETAYAKQIEAQDTQIALHSADLTAAKEEPTRIVQIADAEAEAQTALPRAWSEIIGKFMLSVLFVVMAWAIVYALRSRKPEAAPVSKSQSAPAPSFGDDHVKVTIEESVEGGTEVRFGVVPCSPEDLTIFSENVGRLGLAINAWDGTRGESPLTARNKRSTILRVRAFLVDFHMAEKNVMTGELSLNMKGKKFFEQYLITGTLPQRWSFSPDFMPSEGETDHTHEIHTYEKPSEAVGGAVGEAVYHPVGMSAQGIDGIVEGGFLPLPDSIDGNGDVDDEK